LCASTHIPPPPYSTQHRALALSDLSPLALSQNKKVNVAEAKPGDVILLPIKGALSERDKEILGGLSATGPRQYVVAEGETASQIAAERDIPMSEVNTCKHTPAHAQLFYCEWELCWCAGGEAEP
jgi:hypothetical protein